MSKLVGPAIDLIPRIAKRFDAALANLDEDQRHLLAAPRSTVAR